MLNYNSKIKDRIGVIFAEGPILYGEGTEDIIAQRVFVETIDNLARDDWETIMPENSEDNALLGGVLLSISMLYDPATSIATLAEQGIEGLEQFEEIYNAMPTMLCGLAMRGALIIENEQ